MPGQALRCWCDIDFKALAHNLKAIRKRIGRNTRIMPLVKADAYGHGMIPVARFLETEPRCTILGCAHLVEGVQLRKAGIRKPILLLSGALESEQEEIIKSKLDVTLSSLPEAQKLARTAAKMEKSVNVHVKVDTGMGRLGTPVAKAQELLDFATRSRALNLQGFYSHYACADDNPTFTRRQWKQFSRLQPPNGVDRHMCNSAGLLTLPVSACDIVRPGLALYGISPVARYQNELKPLLSWSARVVFVKSVSKGSTLSYGATYTAPRKLKVATIAVGYGDGLFRSLSNCGSVLINGARCRILGRVTMDQILVDVSRAGNVVNGTKAVLIGKSGERKILASEMAQAAGTIAYEVWTHITDRVPRLYHP